MARTPTVNRARLGALLRKFRVTADLSQEQLGGRVFGGGARAAQKKLASIETGERSLHKSELLALQATLGITDPALLALMTHMLERSSQRGRWAGFRATYPESFRRAIDLEEDADLIRDLVVGEMPDLLACESYARAIIAGSEDAPSSELLDEAVKARLARTALLANEERRFHFILSEAAARVAPKGDRAVVREQIAHVVEMSKQDNVTVQVVPFIPQRTESAHPRLYPFTKFHIAAEGDFVDSFEYVHIGAPDDRRYINHPSAVQVYDRLFTAAAAAGLDGEDARRFLQEISREYR